ncbi:hypothetical protein [Streptomyces sp. enrichment culture]|uniref:hypothetical protein n=1 Tax=Streptomyces sp. enrichment culture TaxID=1795815 RepID=UPI003F569304
MKTVVIAGGTSGIGRGLARTHLERGGRVAFVGTDQAMAGPGARFVRADLELIDENRRLADRLGRAADPVAVDFVGRHPAVQYVNAFPGTVAPSFAGDHDEAEAAQLGRLRATGKSVETAVGEILPFLDGGAPGHPVAVSEQVAVPPDPRASSPAAVRRLHDCTREVLAR